MITIEEFMTARPYTLQENNTVNDARQIMTEKHIRHIPITDNDNHLLGLVTQRDVLAATSPGLAKGEQAATNTDGSDTALADIMIRNVTVIHTYDSLRQAAVYMQSHKYGCLPVISNERLVGIITDSDFVAIAINMLEQAELAEEETGAEDLIEDIVLPEPDEAFD